MKINILDLGLVLIEDVITNPNQIIENVESLNKKRINLGLETIWKPWQDKDKELFCYEFRLKNIFQIQKDFPFYNEEIDINNSINNFVDLALEQYYKIYPYSKTNLKARENPNILKYVGGGALPPHEDHGSSSRALSVLLYLNDDYEGGEINFFQSNITLKPKAGSILLFPSNFIYIHSVSEIKNGIRYAVPTWLHNTEKIKGTD